jgi:predicted dienelactone hydrolase
MANEPIPQDGHGHADSGVDYDKRDPRYALVAAVAGGIVLTLAVTTVGLTWVYNRVYEAQVNEQQQIPVAYDIQSLRTREDKDLHSYQVVDQGKNVVRIPIERAMDLLEKEIADGKTPYPTNPSPVKKPDAPGAAPAAPAQGTTNVTAVSQTAGSAR